LSYEVGIEVTRVIMLNSTIEQVKSNINPLIICENDIQLYNIQYFVDYASMDINLLFTLS